MSAVSAALRAILAGLLVLLLAACRIDTNVAVTVRDDGSGTVAVTVRFDADAATRVLDLAATLRTNDLVTAGWRVNGPDARDGGVTYTASKPFRSPDELAGVLAEITGPTGVFRDVQLARTRSFAKVTWTFTATADLSKGLAAFSDTQLVGALGGKPLGRDQVALEAELGAPLTSLLHAELAVTMPAAVAANTPTIDGDTATWVFQVGDAAPHELHAASIARARQPLVWAYIAAAAAFVLVVVVGINAVRRRRPILRAVDNG